ncbi:MAG: hypothetical protein NXI30_08505 [bacterium]|nr:hypothetical protein [bacterium]
MINPSASKSPDRRRAIRGAFERLALIASTSALVAGSATPVTAADDDFDPERRWTPAMALQVDVMGTTGKAVTTGTTIVGPRVANAGQRFLDFNGDQVLNPSRSREQITAFTVGGDFELMSPRVASAEYAPRFFLNVNVAAAIGPEVGLARDGNPGRLGIPLGVTDSSTAILGETAVTGRGTKTTVQYQGPQVHAGFGAAFLVDIEGHRFRLKPSVVYSRLPFDVYGVLRRAVRLNTNVGSARTYDNTYRSIEISGKQREIYHGAGAAFEVEYEAGDHLGPFAWSIYIKGQGTRIFGDLETNLSAANPEYPEEQATWTYKHDRWFYRLGTGVRVRFDGTPSRRRR